MLLGPQQSLSQAYAQNRLPMGRTKTGNPGRTQASRDLFLLSSSPAYPEVAADG